MSGMFLAANHEQNNHKKTDQFPSVMEHNLVWFSKENFYFCSTRKKIISVTGYLNTTAVAKSIWDIFKVKKRLFSQTNTMCWADTAASY